MNLTLISLFCALLATGDPVAAPGDSAAPEVPSVARRAAGAALSLVPGMLVPGGGHWMIGDRAGAKKMLLYKGAGLALFALGFAPILYSNAADQVMHAAYPVTVGGFGLFALATLMDLTGALFSGRPPGSPARSAPAIELASRWMHVSDPHFGYDHFWNPGVVARLHQFRAAGDFFHAPADGNTRLRGALAWRPFGPRPGGAPTTDGTFFELSVALSRHAFVPEGFTVLTPEALALGRLDLRRIHPSLSGAFAELGIGWGLERTAYDGVTTKPDLAQNLLVEVAYGLYLGHPVTDGEPGRGGELKFYYSHRHDDWAGGLQGVLGFFGVGGRYFFSRHWGLEAAAERGSATRVTLGAVFRY